MRNSQKGGRMAYLDLGLNPPTNRSLLAEWRRVRGEAEIDLISLADLVQLYHPANLAEVLRRYGRELLTRRKPMADCLIRTSFCFQSVRKAARKRLESGRYRFSLQTGSRLDGSHPEIPHFVYTDHTHLTNLQYPDSSP